MRDALLPATAAAFCRTTQAGAVDLRCPVFYYCTGAGILWFIWLFVPALALALAPPRYKYSINAHAPRCAFTVALLRAPQTAPKAACWRLRLRPFWLNFVWPAMLDARKLGGRRASSYSYSCLPVLYFRSQGGGVVHENPKDRIPL